MLHRFYVCCLVVGCFYNCAAAREWTDKSGKYSIEGDLIATNEESVVIQQANGRLSAVKVSDLSDADREYLMSRESSEALKQSAALQTWTLGDGYKVKGRVVAYGHKDVVVSRKRSRIYVNDRPFQNLPPVYQRIVLRVVDRQEGTKLENYRDLENWLAAKRYAPQSFSCDGVLLELENGDEYAVPFFLFSAEDQEFLQPGWERWKQSADDEKARAQEQFLLEASARAHAQQFQAQQLAAQKNTQIAQVELTLLAAATGVTNIWEIMLYPAPRTYGIPRSVVVPAPNSDLAAARALQQHPGYVVGEARRVR